MSPKKTYRARKPSLKKRRTGDAGRGSQKKREKKKGRGAVFRSEK